MFSVITASVKAGKTRALIEGDLKGRAAVGFVSRRIPGLTISLTLDGETDRRPSCVPPVVFPHRFGPCAV